jgi:type VI secretion system secreted protein Hcp
MPSDYLLEIDGIKGESTDSKHKETIEIESFSWGATHPGTFQTGMGGASGKVNFQDVHFTTRVNKASPNIIKACATGKHINKATLFVRKATGDGGQQDYYKVQLEDVLVSSFQSGGHNGGGHDGNASLPSDQFSFNFAKIEFIYKPQSDKGMLEADIIFKYDIKQQKT